MSPRSTPKTDREVTDERMWARVYNALYFLEKDRELEWLRDVRAYVLQADERERGRAA